MSVRTDRNLQLLFAAMLSWTFGVALYDGLVPIYARQLGASPVELGMLWTVRHVALATGYLIGILVADRVSPRRVMLASWLAGTPVPLLLAAATTYVWLLPGLLLYELTFFGLPIVHAYISQRVPASELATTFGALGATSSVAFLVAPTIGGLIADASGIRATLRLAAVCFALSTALMLALRHDGNRPQTRGALRTFAWDEIRPMAPVLMIYAGIQFVMLITTPFATPFLREARGLSLSEIGFLSSMQAVGGVGLTALAGRLGDRVGIPLALAWATLAYAVGISLAVFGPLALLPLTSVFRARAPMNSLGQAMIGSRAPATMFGRAFAIAGMLSALASAVGVFAGGFAYRAYAGLPLLISAGLAVAIAAAALWVRPGARSG